MPQGGYPSRDDRQPTLLPNLDQPVVTNGVVGLQSPAQMSSNNPRTAATAKLTVGGTITNADTIVIKATCPALPTGSVSATVAVVGADTTDTLAHKLAKALNSAFAVACSQYDRPFADVTAANEVTVSWPGLVGNSVVLSTTVTGSATETITYTPVGGGLAGGAGPIVVLQNFTWPENGVVISFIAGREYTLPNTTVAKLVAQGMPIS